LSENNIQTELRNICRGDARIEDISLMIKDVYGYGYRTNPIAQK